MYRRAIALPPSSAAAALAQEKVKFLRFSFYVMGKALTGEQSCTRTGLVDMQIFSHKIKVHLYLV